MADGGGRRNRIARWRAVAWIVAAACGLAAAPASAQDAPPGPRYPAGMTQIEHVDPVDGRTLNYLLIYPAAPPPAPAPVKLFLSTNLELFADAPIAADGLKRPLVVFSHGAGGNGAGYAWFGQHLAARGYMVAMLYHYRANTYDSSALYVRNRLWQRPRDVSLDITHLLGDATWGPHVDPERIGVAGHSQGGFTALWIGGAEVDPEGFEAFQRRWQGNLVVPPYLRREMAVDAGPALGVRDARVKAAFAMAPGDIQGFGMDAEGLGRMAVPAYLIVGEGDTTTPPDENAAFAAAHIPNATLDILVGPVGHEIFGNECDQVALDNFPEACNDAPGVDRAALHAYIGDAAVAFFDATLGVRRAAPGVTQAYPASYYAASANPAPPRPALEGEVAPDVCIVGAGYSGLSAGLDLAEKGYKVVVLEGAKVGWGASGRNGGQIVNGLNASLGTIEARYGRGVADFVGGLVQEGGRIIRARVAKYGIACDLKDGNVFAAFTEKQIRELEAKQALWRRHGMDEHEMLDRAGMRRHVASDLYLGGMIDHSGGHMHPLNLALGQAAALESLGGVIHEDSLVTGVETLGGAPVARTARGAVRPKTLILAGNAYLGHAVPELENRVMPFSTQMIATAPLGAKAPEILPTDMCVEDVRYILDYYRLSADGRLLFGGGTVYGGTDPADIKAKLLPALGKVFPQLQGVAVDYAWSGNCALSFSRVPQMGRLGPNVYYACGYSGHGVVGSHLFGRILAQAVDGDLTRFDAFAKVPWLPFPGGRRFRVPYSAIGSWWYGLRDRLGV